MSEETAGSGDTAEKTAQDTAQDTAGPRDDLVHTEHVLTLPDGRLEYTASAGRVVLREESSGESGYEGAKPRAQVFLVNFVVDACTTRACLRR